MIYDFKCPECHDVLIDMVLPINHEDDDHPACYKCGEYMGHYITVAPGVMFRDADLPEGGFVAHSMPGRPIITSQKQNRELMKKYDLIDANEMGRPPTKAEQMQEFAETQKSIDAITPTADLKDEMKRQGLSDIVD